MGNHTVGLMFHAGASAFSDEEIDNLTAEKAFAIIDRIGKVVVDTTSLDAEFDDYEKPNEPLGKLLIKAFLPEKYNDWKNLVDMEEDDEELWYDKVIKPFHNKFEFW